MINERRQRREDRLTHSLADYRKKMTRVREVVDSMQHLNDSMKMKLVHYLQLHVDEFAVDRPYDEHELIERELYRDDTYEQIDTSYRHLMCTQPGSKEEEKVLSDLF